MSHSWGKKTSVSALTNLNRRWLDPLGLTSENLNYSKDRVQRSKKHWYRKSTMTYMWSDPR